MARSFRESGRVHFGPGFAWERQNDGGGPSSNTESSREPEGAVQARRPQSQDDRRVEEAKLGRRPADRAETMVEANCVDFLASW